MSRLSLAATDTSNAADTPFDDARASQRLADLLLEVARSVNQRCGAGASQPARRRSAAGRAAQRSARAGSGRARRPAAEARRPAAVRRGRQRRAGPRLRPGRDPGRTLAAVLAPTWSAPRRMAIRKDPSTLVGILYPLVGPAIRKSIAETLDGTLQGLNQAFKHSFSWRGLKWRLEAYRSGSSFADVVLKHTVVFRVEHLFLIHRKTGLLLEHVAASEAADAGSAAGLRHAHRHPGLRARFVRANTGRGAGAASTACGSATCFSGARRDHSPFSRPSSGATRPRRSARSCATRSPASTRSCAARSRNSRATARTLGDLATRLKACLQQQEQPPEKRLSPWLWALPLVLLVDRRFLAGVAGSGRVSRRRLRAAPAAADPAWSSPEPSAAMEDGRSQGCAIRWPPIRPTCWRSRTSIRHASSATGNPIWR